LVFQPLRQSTRFVTLCRPRYVRESARPVLLSPYSVTGTGW
jgi:hypothetical protein